MLIILFGLSGVGKNYVGNLIAQQFQFSFWDGDEALTPEMKQFIAEKKIFTQSMRDEFCAILIKEIQQKQPTHSKLVVAQGLYKEKNRQQILDAFPNAQFVHVTADFSTIQKRLTHRQNDIELDYLLKISQAFEPTQLFHCVLNNNIEGSDSIQQQLREIL